ncbi:MAG: MopE-related protein, partial [Myxococcota bacterium]
CNDANGSVYPNAPEQCNSQDDDCDGTIDDGSGNVWYRDSDNDGFGLAASTTTSCTQPVGYAPQPGDCNDANGSVYPNAPEQCNSQDDDCDGTIDEGVTTSTWYRDADGDNYGISSDTKSSCNQPSGYVMRSGDCNDIDASINPGAAELCNNRDDNCNTSIDEGVSATFYADGDGDGFGNPNSSTQGCVAPTGYVSKAGDCNDANASVNPASTEACNDLDDDCDGSKDEGVSTTYFQDTDGDGFGSSSSTVQACSRPEGYATVGTDCDDGDEGVYPGATEYVGDGRDSNCDGIYDGLRFMAGAGPYNGETFSALQTAIHFSADVVTDGSTLYLADQYNHRIRKLVGGTLITVAGTGEPGYSGDGGPATSARLYLPRALAIDPRTGDLFIADGGNHCIRRISSSTGVISTVAGTGSAGSSGSSGPATQATFNEPKGLAVDRDGWNLYIADTKNHVIRRVILVDTGLGAVGTISTVVGSMGSSGSSGDNALATAAKLNEPRGIDFDYSGNLYIADTNNHRVRRYNVTDKKIYAFAGSGSDGDSGDGGAATSAELDLPGDVSVDVTTSVAIADTGNHRVRIVGVDKKINLLAGSSEGFSGDAGAANVAKLQDPLSVSCSGGEVYVLDSGNFRVRKVAGLTGASVISTVLGAGMSGFSGDSLDARAARMSSPRGTAMDAQGNLYVADSKNHRIRKVSSIGRITSIAGTGVAGYDGEGTASLKQLNQPYDVALDASGANLYIADTKNQRVRKLVLATGIISTVAGAGTAGSTGDNGAATAAKLNEPRGLLLMPDGTLYIADTKNHKIRKVSVSNTITTFAGAGSAGNSGDNGPAVDAKLSEPHDIVSGLSNDFFIADTNNHKIRRVTSDLKISTWAGTGTAGSTGDGGAATSALLNKPVSLARDGFGQLFVAESSGDRIRRITGSGSISTLVGSGDPYTQTGETDLPTKASCAGASGLTLAPSGILVISELDNHRVMKLIP